MQIQQWDNIFYRFYPADKRNYKGYSVVINADLPTKQPCTKEKLIQTQNQLITFSCYTWY